MDLDVFLDKFSEVKIVIESHISVCIAGALLPISAYLTFLTQAANNVKRNVLLNERKKYFC